MILCTLCQWQRVSDLLVLMHEFARTIQTTDNYYVIVSRESLPNLPYSVEEIYGIHTSGRYGRLRQVYHEFHRMYGLDSKTKLNAGYLSPYCRQRIEEI